MRYWPVLLALLLPVGPVWAAIAHDATGTFGTTPDTVSPMEWSHNPVGTPRGIIVLIVTNDTNDTITGVTYDGTGLTRIIRQNVGGELGSAYAYFLGTNVPTTDPATVTVTFTGSANHMGVSVSVTAADNTSVEDSDFVSSTSLANPSMTMTTAFTTLTYGALYSGTGGPTSTAPDANHTDITEADLGAETSSTIRRTATVAAGSPIIGWTVAADDVAAVAIAVREGVPAALAIPRRRAVVTD